MLCLYRALSLDSDIAHADIRWGIRVPLYPIGGGKWRHIIRGWYRSVIVMSQRPLLGHVVRLVCQIVKAASPWKPGTLEDILILGLCKVNDGWYTFDSNRSCGDGRSHSPASKAEVCLVDLIWFALSHDWCPTQACLYTEPVHLILKLDWLKLLVCIYRLCVCQFLEHPDGSNVLELVEKVWPDGKGWLVHMVILVKGR